MRIPVEVAYDEFIEELVWELSYEEIIEFILNIDEEVSDSVFTEMLKKAVAEWD